MSRRRTLLLFSRVHCEWPPLSSERLGGVNVNLTPKRFLLRISRQSFKKKKKIEVMNDRLTVEWLRSANCRSRCQTLQTYMRTVVVHISENGLKRVNMCITKRALHYLWEWIRARRGDVIAHATRSLGLRSVAGADERWPQLMWILCTINICSPASLQKEKG